MTATITTADTEVSFEKQFNGYDKGQVDRYIISLANAYQTAYDEYKVVCDKYSSLLEDYEDLKTKETERPAAEIITKTLVDSESLAHKIVTDANAEAARILDEARTNAKRIAEDTYTEKAVAKLEAQRLIDEAGAEAEELKENARMILSRANLEAATTQEKSKKVVDYAHIEASQIVTQAEKDRREAYKILKSAVENIQCILARDEMDIFETDATERQAADTPYIYLPNQISVVS